MKTAAVTIPTCLPAPAPTLPPPGTKPAIFMGWGPRVHA
jgi:hypothetical protein